MLPRFWLRCPPSTTVSHTYTFMIPIIHFGEAGKNSFAAGFYRSEYGGYLWSHFTTSFFICSVKYNEIKECIHMEKLVVK